ncbi:hypothetical protein LTR37_011492 [Vermiconidia calcicola]|uniref:Uncharacterized protein n=1 Tax=Vermiconidia calcicola TaxID=1690605 RepID=A0ACC3N1U5_9PEZI|nr:hypothetical protein LTR37_011492 [Vermiconidia calcicola]
MADSREEDFMDIDVHLRDPTSAPAVSIALSSQPRNYSDSPYVPSSPPLPASDPSYEGSQGAQPRPRSSAHLAEESGADLVATLEYLHRLFHLVGAGPQLGYLGEGLHYMYRAADRQAVRAFEGAFADGAEYLGTIDLSDKNFAEKLELLGQSDQDSLVRDLAYEDSKICGFSWYRDGKTLGTGTMQLNFQMSDRQSGTLSHGHLGFTAAPGMVSLMPGLLLQGSLSAKDILIYYTPIPPRFTATALPLDLLRQAHSNVRETYSTQADYVVPGSGVRILPWKQICVDPPGLAVSGAAQDAFDFLFQAIKTSQYARDNRITIDLAQRQPLGGDATLLQPDRAAEKVEMKWGLVVETHHENGTPALRITQLGFEDSRRKRASLFHPLRIDNFVVLLSANREYLYWIPAQFCVIDFWVADEHVMVPREHFARFRVDIRNSGADWIETVYESIINRHRQSSRPAHELPAYAFAEHYKAAAVEEIKEETFGVDESRRGQLTGYPWPKIERWNRECAHIGYGLFLPLSRQEKVANVVWFGHKWSVQDRAVYWSTGQLPKALHQGDIDPTTPMLLIRAIHVVTMRGFSSLEFPANVAGRRLDRLEIGHLPCLYYVDCETWAMRGEERSGLLFPEEFIDYDYLHQQYSEFCGTRVTSAREFSAAVQEMGYNRSSAWYLIARHTDLRRCLTAPYTEFMIREGEELPNAIHDFANSHLGERKLVSWFECADLYADRLSYLVQFKDLLQRLGDEHVSAVLRRLQSGVAPGNDDSDELDDEELSDEERYARDAEMWLSAREGEGGEELDEDTMEQDESATDGSEEEREGDEPEEDELEVTSRMVEG